MARDLRSESEFGLPLLPDPFGNVIPEGATGAAAITGLTDSDAIKAGGNDGSLSTTGYQLREVYAVEPGMPGPTEPKAGTS